MSYLNLFKPQKLKFAEKKKEAQNAHTFYFEKGNLKYQAGQHFIVYLKHKKMDKRGPFRIFSMSAAPSEKFVSFTTRYFGDESSSFKRALMKLKKGDTLTFRGPSPIFDVYKIDDYSKPHIFIAGGIGITPFRSLIVDSVNTNKKLKGKLYYANRDSDVIFGDEIKKYVDKMDGFKMMNVTSPKRIEIDDLKKDLEKYGDETIFTISGTIHFVSNYANLLSDELEVNGSNIKAYKYRGFVGSYK